MKKELKNIFIPFVMSVVFAFMLFIYEPIVTYSSNITDYWFDFKLLIVNNLKIFIVMLLLLLLLSFIIYYICKKIKKEYLYDIYLIVFFMCLVAIYIQGNYLAGSLPSLDGSPIIWSSYKIETAISIGLWLIVILLSIYIYKKHKNIYKKIISYTSLGIFAMLLVSLISVLLTSKDLFKSKGVLFSMNDNINNVSKGENFFILLIDCVDSVEFNKVLKENNKEDIFDDFTYYPDTLSTYGFTRDSIPFILSGIWYEAETSYQDYYNYAFDNSKLFNLLKENGQMCYIVPNKFYKIGAGQELRRIISKHVSKLDDFGDMQLFPDKTIYSCIITLCKESSKQMEYTNVTSLIDLWTGEEQESIRIKNELLDENPWRLTTDIKFMKMIATAEENGKPLGEIVNIFNGIQTSAERPKPVYWFDKDEIVSETEEEIIVDKFEKRYHIEKRILKPFFKPTKADEKGMGTYSLLKTDKHIIFPYNADGSLINVEIMKKEYPGTYQYLQDCYDLLVPKCLNGGKGRDIKNASLMSKCRRRNRRK